MVDTYGGKHFRKIAGFSSSTPGVERVALRLLGVVKPQGRGFEPRLRLHPIPILIPIQSPQTLVPLPLLDDLQNKIKLLL
ncbi:hypothetical protein KC349_g32 [Hortaea werneckii]|nr:hypothetical protein KC349_g32 [Hortaea werneckii]